MDSSKEFKDDKCDNKNLTEVLNYQKTSTLSMEERLKFLYHKTKEHASELPRKLSTTDKSEYAIIDSKNPFQIEYYDQSGKRI